VAFCLAPGYAAASAAESCRSRFDSRGVSCKTRGAMCVETRSMTSRRYINGLSPRSTAHELRIPGTVRAQTRGKPAWIAGASGAHPIHNRVTLAGLRLLDLHQAAACGGATTARPMWSSTGGAPLIERRVKKSPTGW